MVDYNKYFSAFDGVQDGIAKMYSGIVYAVSMILMFISRPIDMLLTAIAQVQGGAEVGGTKLTDLSWVFKLVFAVFGFLFVFSTDSTDTVIAQGSPEYFGLHVLLARATIFFSSLMAAFIGLSDILVKISTRMPGLDIGLPSFEGVFSEYTAAFIHGATSLTIIAASFLWEEDLSLAKQLANATVTDPARRNDTSVAYLTLILIAAYVLKLWQELRHGAQQQAITDGVIAEVRDVSSFYKFKHARGPAITISVALLMFMLSNLPANTHWYDDLWGTPAYVLLVAYIVVVALERVAVKNNQEWVYGGAHGLVIVGGITQALLFFTGTLVGNHLTQDSIVFALGVVVLDAMRVGYGQASPESAEKALGSDKTAILYRLFQGLFGILAFVLITVTPHESVDVYNSTTGALITSNVKTQAVAAPVLYGIGLGSALVKVMSLLFLTKTLFKNGTENYYRELASTGLLVCSAYLWEHPLDETLRPGWAILFFVLAIMARFADSFTHHVLARGVDLKSYVSWYLDDTMAPAAVDMPTSDNPRVWLTLAALVSALWFSSTVMNDDWSNIRLDNHTNALNQTVDAPANKEQSSGMITAVFFIALHVAVVVVGLISEVMPALEMGALSRSKLIRTAVSTVVISSLSVSAGALTIGETALLSSDSSEARLVLALVSYVVADTVGRELV